MHTVPSVPVRLTSFSPIHSTSIRRGVVVVLCALLAGCRGEASSRAPSAGGANQSATVVASHIDSLLTAGDSVYRSSPARAATLWKAAYEEARVHRDSVRLALALTGRAQAAKQLGQNADARRWGEAALALKLRLGLRAQLFRSYNMLGLLAWQEDRADDAARLFASAAAAARAVDDASGMAKARMNEGLVLQEQAMFTEASFAFVEAQSQFATLGDSANLARTLNNRAALALSVGRPVIAESLLTATRLIARSTADSTLELNARGQMAITYAARGQPKRAFGAIDSAIMLARTMRALPELAENLRVLADLYLDAGDTRHALMSYADAAALQDSLEQPIERGNLLRQQARAHRLDGNLLAATRMAREALQTHDRVGALAPAFDDLLLALDLAVQRGDHERVRQTLDALTARSRRLGTATAAGQLQLATARVRAWQERWSEVITALAPVSRTRSAPEALLVGADDLAERHLLLARAYAALGKRARAASEARAAVSLVDQVRASHASGELRARYTETRARIYVELVVALLRQGDVGEAFRVADAARGRSLVERLGEARRNDISTPNDDTELLLRRIDALVRRLRQQDSQPQRDRSTALMARDGAMRDTLRVLRSRFEALRSRRSAEAGRFDGASVSVTTVRERLGKNELLLEYLATPSQLIVFVVSRDTSQAVQVDVPADTLAARISLVRALLDPRHEAGDARALLTRLHRDLIAPVLPAIDRMLPPGRDRPPRRLVLVPHGVLSVVPFAALLDGRTGTYLVEDFSLLHAPSASAFAHMRDAPAPERPVAVHAFAPETRRLPATHREVQVVSASRVHDLDGVAFEDQRATEQQLRASVGTAAVVHVAGHAVVNGNNPLFSRLELQPDDVYDGRLEVHEVLSLHVRAPLVFLSGCETALGNVRTTRFDAGDDFTSLAQAWIMAGARTVVATLWRIDDEAASVFAAHFYRALRQQPTPEALADAQRIMLRDPTLRRPYLWAAYQVSGAP